MGKYDRNNITVPLGARKRGRGRRLGPVEKPKNLRKTILRLWKYFGSERKLLVIILISVIIDSVVGLIGPYLIGRAIDAMSESYGKVNFNMLWIMIMLLLLTYVVDTILTFFQGWIMSGVAQRIIMGLRKNLFGKLQKLPLSFFDMNTHGEIMSRLTNDVENVSSTISQSTVQLMSGVITVLGSFVMMLILSPFLTFVTLITVPMVFLLTKSIAKKTNPLFKDQQIELGKLNGHIEETISGIQVVKAFNHGEKCIEEFNKINSSLCEVGLKAQIWSGFLMPIMNVINNIGFAAVAGVGGVLALKNIITVGIIASFLSYSRQFARPLNDIASIFNTLQSAAAGAERVFEVLDEKEELEDISDAKVFDHVKGRVSFENVSFCYRKDVKILKNISFDISPGTKVALVGPTGAGKTTIVNLVTRFYDVSAGKILIDGEDIRNYKRDSLRKCFGIVLQDTYLFAGTILENIRYGKLDADFTEIKQAVRFANAETFIEKLPQKYNTLIHEGGNNLSQGERQLIAISRAILSNPAILVLDEATSNVDTLTELKIEDAMNKLMKGRTSFIIAHRLSTIKNSDIIMVVDKGEIVEKGSHKDLIKKKSMYYNMYNNQFYRKEPL
ncbi:ABC transporter ATP-binding protein [Clostridium autoethanogenum]|uniref:ABC transporter ATP-binding protein n=2 Tax=Clostridium autoethanogenum TaxID=84023 RepID=A0A3M0SUP4_9CLOT|nr:ABC transporter ATP-binding protein [Clostridium autoethanogenum]AGY77190.1 ABC transporter ATP-binding protein/permease [Clostridium autoethanogenum DSM 10061]ALU37333.1 Multidrug ABC-type transporter ATP-binding protein [Clostridium autoethanogenum DSM 10061]OVY50099.1 putative ABC transporter ATP-binding protein [Clostridium autoethanogenum]RMC98357.1 ABC transporter ATP-binding protein [Clostridium autoethanogenum]